MKTIYNTIIDPNIKVGSTVVYKEPFGDDEYNSTFVVVELNQKEDYCKLSVNQSKIISADLSALKLK